MRILRGNIEKRDKGRNFKSRSRLGLLHYLVYILAFLPVFGGCVSQGDENLNLKTEIIVTKATDASLNVLDLFFFNNDTLGRLDSYQRFDAIEIGTLTGASRNGLKKVAVIANFSDDLYTWSDINSYQTLWSFKANLDVDDPQRPVMTGVSSINAGKESSCKIRLRPILSEVVLRSIRCDFSSRSYRNEKLKDIKVYLTNVNSAWPILADTLSTSGDYINVGRADSTMISKMVHPEYIYSDWGQNVGNTAVKADLHFYCYPNSVKEESMGSPFTRIVIEGKIGGITYYYPLNVNRRNDAKGIERNCRYILDVVLTRRGTTDPDTAMDAEDAQVSVEVTEWSEKENQYVSF